LSAGDFVIAFDVSAQALAKCEAERWAAHCGAVLSVAGDVSNVADIRRLVDEALSVRGQIDVLINNAGITGSHAATDVHSTSWMNSTA